MSNDSSKPVVPELAPEFAGAAAPMQSAEQAKKQRPNWWLLLGLPAWAFFTVVLSPISLASFLIGEHLLRYRWHPEFDRASLRHTIRTWREGGA